MHRDPIFLKIIRFSSFFPANRTGGPRQYNHKDKDITFAIPEGKRFQLNQIYPYINPFDRIIEGSAEQGS
jgi:hypothetical protein